ncbi:hypothetical protein [Microtetraspora sp. NBRC 16547]|uniref:hypothetical protein n=1 Tax=Microtetraspora sp. NBRC 16547 TaxID=3030993 RepID=UPI0024A3A99E|nr:hypothetical protein [Microtetraspora sp. NBRC 16547]GLX00182.1 hypothetical protein Misp02_42680 [Microtetraspora sp. NBRC 16547]
MKANSKVLGLIMGVFFVPLSLTGCTESGEPSGETKIFEIANTEEVVGKKGEEVLTLRKHYMILNPPRDLIDLKDLVEGYIKGHPVESENRFLHLSFYRESGDLPRDWQPDEGYMNTDRLEHHKNDLIASITRSDTRPEKEYDIYDKSEEGKILKRIRFIEDRLVE